MSPIENTPDGGFVATGTGITVYQFKATQHAAKLRAAGIFVTSPKKFPTILRFCEQWHIDPPVRTWAELYEEFLRREALWKLEYDADEKYIEVLTHGKLVKT